ncbi:CDP-diacylglycerol--serine O-phosphatidyltransferase [Bacillus rugosus]|uniref:CDP-diacylglycerol--serine O-phosphatidyltransferase n=1 Tax=Bacillus rugosus TaxID=2715209 RepID=UPI002DBD0102|nr:CDP-diacylglycerol--serine O-phosphatidyltransferase [Bacillus rugosus]MEC1548285.1 CDP-diacylglycerol--serine O-phosphatidyltransferase [Bacillus rugosus]
MIYIPNIITIGNLICGLLAIYSLLVQDIYSAATLIFIGLFFDFFDGMIARKLNAVSDIGRELDSMADMVTFGVAPSIFAYYTCLYELSITGVLCMIIYSICSLLRLAKFNVKQSKLSTFVGMPTPLAGICLVTLSTMHNQILLVVGIGIISCLMISNIKFPQFKKNTMESLGSKNGAN